MSLSSLIVQREIATIRQVEEALARQVLYGGDLVTNLLEVGRLDEPTLTRLLAESFGMAPAALGPLPEASAAARDRMPAELASRRAVVPLAIEGGALVVAAAEPLDAEAAEELQAATSLPIEARIAPMVRVREALSRMYGAPLERRLQRLLQRLVPVGEPVAPQVSLHPDAPLVTSRPPPASSSSSSSSSSEPASAMRLTPPEALRSLVQSEVAIAPRPLRRRRGPLTPDVARRELEEVAARDDILDLFFDFARQYFDYAVLFVVHGGVAEGRDAFGHGTPRDRVTGIAVPLDAPSVLAKAREAAAPVQTVLSTEGLDPVLLGELQREAGSEVLVVPVVVRRRTVALFYGDNGDLGVDPDGAKQVASFALAVGQAFERLIVRKKLHGMLGSIPPGPVASSAPPAPSPLAASIVPPSSAAAAEPTDEGAPPSSDEPAEPTPPLAPDVPEDVATREAIALLEELSAPAAVVVAPRRPPSARAGASPALPSVIVDVDREFGAMVDRVIAGRADETSEAELLRQGQHAMPAIMSRFPGPTTPDRARVEDGTMRVADCGPVMRLVAGQRRVALPFVITLLEDPDVERRYWATLLLTELTYPEAIDALAPRLFDADPAVRRVARLAARALGDVAPDALVATLGAQLDDPAAPDPRRVEMIDTLAELRERLAVPLLAAALNDVSDEVASAARRALVVLTRQDFGRDAKKWGSWWKENAGRHRVEWLIDALMHENAAMRRAAGEELKGITKEYFGYYDDLPKRERERAQQRYRDWWASEGKSRFRRT